MRKHFLMMMATAICALVITSCVKGPDDIPPSPTPTPTPTPTPEEKFDAAFVKYVEKPISSNQDWGFGMSKVAGARGFTRGSEKGYYISDNYPKQYTQEFFTQALDSLKQGQKVGESIKKRASRTSSLSPEVRSALISYSPIRISRTWKSVIITIIRVQKLLLVQKRFN